VATLLAKWRFVWFMYSNFLNSMMCSDNNVITLVLGVFIHSVEFSKLCNLVCVSHYDSRYKIKRCVKSRSIASVTCD